MKSVLIIGHGVVGQNLEKHIKLLNPDIKDKYKQNVNTYVKDKVYDIAFVCVDTPRTEKNSCDITEVMNAINENLAKIYVIKSTVLPGTTEKIERETGKNIVFSPEYYGATQHNDCNFNFTIVGGKKENALEVIQVLQDAFDAYHKFAITDFKTAELVKYMENSWIATKVSFCVEFYNIAESLGVKYEELRELFLLDKRVSPSHTFVYRDKAYWDSHCLNKDVKAIAKNENSLLLKEIIKVNEQYKVLQNIKKML